MTTVPLGGEAAREGDDEHLAVSLVPAADHDAEFAAFMLTASPPLARLAWLLCGDEHRAEELVQQALVRTYLAWPRARDRDPLAYARRVLSNQRIDTWRLRRREVLMSPAALPETARAGGDDQHASRDLLVRALGTLTPRQRRVVVLRHMVGLSEAEVAADLGVSLGTVKSTSSRALRTLRGVLADRADVQDVLTSDSRRQR
jgi:RNA polymerase sigma-70 factor (sigma-E family)